MVKLFFILPLLLCLAWWTYLRQNNWTLEQGKKGFYYIIGLSLVVSVFYLVMYVLNHYIN